MTVFVTGVAGFIGMHVALKLLQLGHNVIGIDNLNAYYDPSIKTARLDKLSHYEGFKFHKIDISDTANLMDLWTAVDCDAVVHLAAQAGVRYGLKHPHKYIDSNILGFLNILELCRVRPVQHLVYASSSSVYGANTKLPFSEIDSVDHPISLYAATKKSNELMAHAYSHLFQIPTTGLRFFTVYGPWGRPDMSPILFAKAILEGKPIQIFNYGDMMRDYTFIDDVIEGVIRVLNKPPIPGLSSQSIERLNFSKAPYRIFNIGNHMPIPLERFIDVLENRLARKAIREYLPMQDGDVIATSADVQLLKDWVGFEPSTSIEVGIGKFIDWYLSYNEGVTKSV